MTDRDYIRRWSRARNYAMAALVAERSLDWQLIRDEAPCLRDAKKRLRAEFPDLWADHFHTGRRINGL